MANNGQHLADINEDVNLWLGAHRGVQRRQRRVNDAAPWMPWDAVAAEQAELDDERRRLTEQAHILHERIELMTMRLGGLGGPYAAHVQWLQRCARAIHDSGGIRR